MSLDRNFLLLLNVILIISTVINSSPSPQKDTEEEKNSPDLSDDESEKKNKGTVSSVEIKKLEEEIIENQEENAEKFGLPLTSAPEDIEKFLKVKEEEFGTQLPEVIENEFTDGGDLKNFVNFVSLFDKIETEASDKEEDEEVEEKSPAEMKEMKDEVFKLSNEIHEKQGLPKISHEEFNKVWNQKKEEYGKQFPRKMEAVIILMKTMEIAEEATTIGKISESVTETSTEESDTSEEEAPKEAFIVKSAKGKICILAKFHSAITITYTGKESEQKVEVSVPSNGNSKGKCSAPNRSPSMQISWEKFIFSLTFNKTSEDTWGVTFVELTYDTSEPLFDGAVNRAKVTVKSKKESLFETPFGKSYFCPAQEVIFLYSENQHVATVRLKEVHLQPYDVEDGKFSPSHRCNQVVIGGLDEEPFVQDETIPLAVGCTLALITLLILVGFSVHRAYNAAKVDYNAME